MTTMALVESATQLLNVIEWAHRTEAVSGSAHDVRVVVLGAEHENTRRQLVQVGRLAVAAGLSVDTIELRRASRSLIWDAGRLMRDLSRAEQLVLGDPFSGLVHSMLPFVRPSQVVVVDDGTATWEFRDCLDQQRPLLRWRDRKTGSRRAARATRLLSPGRARELTVFSCLAHATPVGAFGVANDYTWTRARSVPEVRRETVDVIGASLVETGIVERAAYVAAVARLAHDGAPVRYLAHRRESDEGLSLLAALPGITVARPDLPVELTLRQGPVAERVVAFPSTAAHTLPIVLADCPVGLEVRVIGASMFTCDTTSRIRRFVQRIADEAPLAIRAVA